MGKKYEASEAQLKVLEQLTRCQNEVIDDTITDLFIAIGNATIELLKHER